jgi:hypothetical protein
MELLLNLAWLLLALPAYWLWRASRTVPAGRKISSWQCLLALGCMLVILFPVVSATDDLCAMRTEMEESPASKRTIRQASPDKVSAWKWQSQPALAGSANSLIVNDEDWQQSPAASLSVPAAPAIERVGRAPPDSFPG